MSEIFTPFSQPPPQDRALHQVSWGIEVARFPKDEPDRFEDLYDDFADEGLMDKTKVKFYLPEPEADNRLGIYVVKSRMLMAASRHHPEDNVTLTGLAKACIDSDDSRLRKEEELAFDRLVINQTDSAIYMNMKPSAEKTVPKLNADVDEVAALMKAITGHVYMLNHIDYGLPIARINKSHTKDEVAKTLARKIEAVVNDYLSTLKGTFTEAHYAAVPDESDSQTRRNLMVASA